MKFFDFKFLPLYGHHRTAFDLIWEAVHERGSNGFRSTHGVHSDLPVSDLRRPIPGQPLRQSFLLMGSVPLFGVRSAHLPHQSPRHRSLSARPATQALPYGLPRSSFPRHPRRRQRASRLADLCRPCPSVDWHGPRPLPRRIVRGGVERERVRLRLHHHRFVSVALPLGPVSPPQERRQVAHLARPAGQHSDQLFM